MDDEAVDNQAQFDGGRMAGAAPPSGGGEPESPLADAETLDQLRELLVGPERRELEALRERLASSRAEAQDIARLLPQAITLREREDDQLGRALSPTVEAAIQTSVKNNPQPMIDAVFPVIGPAIRKAVSEALAGAVQSLNQTLEHSLSLRSLKWRIEAARTGKPFAEVVLLNTLRYRVEQVFLIHAESGLLIKHLAADGVETRDEQLVSGMFTAITDFVRDSFATDERAGLRTMQVGGVTVWVERGPHAVLAGAVRGSAPAELREVFQRVIEDLHLRHGEWLETFNGDEADADGVEPELRRCLVTATQPGAKRKVSLALIVFGLVVAALLLWAVIAGVSSNVRWGRYVEQLENTPGVMLVAADHNWWGRSSVRGLVAPDAEGRPEDIRIASGVPEGEVEQRWEPYASVTLTPLAVEVPEPAEPPAEVEPTLLEWARDTLSPPGTVTLRTEGSVLVAEGVAPRAWIESTRATAGRLIGSRMSSYVDRDLISLEIQTLETLAGRIESAVVAMPEGSALDLSSQREGYEQLVRDLADARDTAGAVGMELIVEVVGHTDTTGDATSNVWLSEARAAAVVADLESRFVPPITMVIRGAGSSEPSVSEDASAEEQKRNRRVTFNVELQAKR